MKSMILGFFLLLAWSSGVQAQTAFYQGKSIKHVVGSPADLIMICMAVSPPPIWESTSLGIPK
jgi:hypothetical protein